MSSAAARLQPWARERAGSLGLPLALGGVVALTGLSMLLRTQAMRAGFWIDEGIAVGISSFPLTEIPEVLRQDGSPPLYYLMLHVWMQLVGNGEAATHALSLGFSLLTIPVAWWAGRSLFGARAGWMAAVVAALHPFLTFYAQETRMYSLAALLSLGAAALFVHGFVERRRAAVAGYAAVLLALLYTHNWGFFFAGASVVALWIVWRASEDRGGVLRDGLLANGAVALLYLPWLPSLLFQAGHTGAPWASRPGVDDLVSAGSYVLGNADAAPVLLIVAGSGFVALLGRRRGLVGREGERRRVAATTLLVLLFGTLLLAWLASQASPAWAGRYLAVVIGPAILAAAVGLAHARKLGIAALVLLAVLWFDPRIGEVEGKSNVRTVAASLEYRPLERGDLVVSTHPEQTPVLHYYLGDRFRYATSLGPVADPRVFDWRDAQDRLATASPELLSDRLIRTLAPGDALVLVQPILRTGSWRAPWTALVREKAVEWERSLERDPRLRRSEALPRFGFKPLPRGVRAVIYRVREP